MGVCQRCSCHATNSNIPNVDPDSPVSAKLPRLYHNRLVYCFRENIGILIAALKEDFAMPGFPNSWCASDIILVWRTRPP